MFRRCIESVIVERGIERAEVPINNGFSQWRRGFEKGERNLVDQNKSLDGDIECGFVCDEKEGVEMYIDSRKDIVVVRERERRG